MLLQFSKRRGLNYIMTFKRIFRFSIKSILTLTGFKITKSFKIKYILNIQNNRRGSYKHC